MLCKGEIQLAMGCAWEFYEVSEVYLIFRPLHIFDLVGSSPSFRARQIVPSQIECKDILNSLEYQFSRVDAHTIVRV